MSPQADIGRHIAFGPFSHRCRLTRAPLLRDFVLLLPHVAGIESAGDSDDSKATTILFSSGRRRTGDKNLYGESGRENGIGYSPYIPGVAYNIHPTIGVIVRDLRRRLRSIATRRSISDFNVCNNFFISLYNVYICEHCYVINLDRRFSVMLPEFLRIPRKHVKRRKPQIDDKTVSDLPHNNSIF